MDCWQPFLYSITEGLPVIRDEFSPRNCGRARVRDRRNYLTALLARQSKSDERWAMYALLQDLRYGLRIMRKSPGFTAVVLIVLGLGIGGNTAIFSIVNGVLLEPLPYPRADQLVSIRSAEPSRGIPPVVASYADYLDWKQQAHAFSNMGTYVSEAFNLSA